MKFLLLTLPFFMTIAIVGCSGSSSPSAAIDTTATQTCYDVKVNYSGSSETRNICTTLENGEANGLGVSRYLRFTAPSSTLSIRVTRTSGLNPADPDIYIYQQGVIIAGADTTNSNTEVVSTSLSAGEYVAEILEYNYFSSEKTQPLKSQQAKLAKRSELISQAPSSVTSNCTTGSDFTVSGVVTYVRIPHAGTALDYSNPINENLQQAVVEVICGTGVYSSTVTSSAGLYSLNFPSAQASIVRVKAQMKPLTGTAWNFSVVDNLTPGKPVYAMDSSSFNLSADHPLDLHAPSGWTGSSYTGTRVAAPFAILDSVRKAKDKILSANASAVFPALQINWSVSNVPAPGDKSLGQITTSHYDTADSQIYLLGAVDNDTDEYDEHVIIHEWGHYFEDKLSRSDSIGGPHSTGDVLDMRVAYSEGFGNAFSAIVTDDPLYIDTSGVGQSVGFRINIENNNCTNPGWFSECSVQSVLFDIADTTNDGVDTLSLGFGSIYDVLVGPQKTTPAFTSIFSFVKSLKVLNGASANEIDALTSAQSIQPVDDIYGDSETINNPGSTNQLPIYSLF